ncbi:MAG TPA: ATP-binding protein [Chitinophagales bacterium]|nr:ATP-binding protein [Chitinophagales bacterium]
MSDKLKILHLEDFQYDSELVDRELEKAGIDFEKVLVDDQADFVKALTDFCPDIILSDHSLPSFNSLEALKLARRVGNKVPFILVTSTVSEEFAVTVMKEGADDYVLKDRLKRLPGALVNVIEKYRLEEERKRVVDKSLSDEALLNEAERLAHFGSWQTDLAKGTTRWSDETYRIFGYAPGEVEPASENILKRVHPDDKARVLQSIAETKQGLHNSLRIDFRVVAQNGEVKYVRSQLVVEKNEEGTPCRITGFNQDITEIKLAEIEIQKLNESLERKVEERTAQLLELNKELESFSYSVSHDLRSPLKIINGYSSILAKNHSDSLNEEGQTLLQEIKKYTVRMASMIDDVLQFSRTGRVNLAMKSVDMNQIVQVVLREMYGIKPGCSQSIIVKDLPPAHCDAQLIKQVWFNLVSNAVKYSEKNSGAEIEIGAYAKDGETIYYVKDNGAGFNMKYAGKLFGVFQRLHKIDEYEGTGVGLAIVHRIITKHGGKVWADSTENEGSVFSFSLPA